MGWYNHADLDSLILDCMYGYYVKYDTLIPLINQEFNNSRANKVYIYIDIQDILRHVDSYVKRNQLPVNNILVITSGIINMVAHYRNFFATRYRCKTKFWLVDSIDNIISKSICPEFFSSSVSPSMYNMYNSNIELLSSICLYIQDVQYEKTEVDFVTKAIAINDIENRDTHLNNPAILITKDPFAYQACIENIYVLRPKKNNTGDVSKLIKSYTAVTEYLLELSKDAKTSLPINIKQLSMVMALTRVPSRHLKTLYTINGAMDRLYNAYKNLATRDYIWDLDNFLNIFFMSNKGKVNEQDIQRIKSRYLACEAVQYQYLQYQSLAESKTYNGMVNLYDPKSIQEINNKYFQSCPLDLNVL